MPVCMRNIISILALCFIIPTAIAIEIERVSVSSAGSEANSSSENLVISADGRFVVFRSEASNLVAGDTNSYHLDNFVHDGIR